MYVSGRMRQARGNISARTSSLSSPICMGDVASDPFYVVMVGGRLSHEGQGKLHLEQLETLFQSLTESCRAGCTLAGFCGYHKTLSFASAENVRGVGKCGVFLKNENKIQM